MRQIEHFVLGKTCIKKSLNLNCEAQKMSNVLAGVKSDSYVFFTARLVLPIDP